MILSNIVYTSWSQMVLNITINLHTNQRRPSGEHSEIPLGWEGICSPHTPIIWGDKIPRAAPYVLQATSYKIVKYFVHLSIYTFSYMFDVAVELNSHPLISNITIPSSKFSAQ